MLGDERKILNHSTIVNISETETPWQLLKIIHPPSSASYVIYTYILRELLIRDDNSAIRMPAATTEAVCDGNKNAHSTNAFFASRNVNLTDTDSPRTLIGRI